MQSGSFGLTVPIDNSKRYLFAAWTYGSIEIYLQWLKRAPAFNESKRHEFLARLNRIAGITLPADAIDRRPSIKLATLVQPDRLQQLLRGEL
jgi:hypothetical protein